MYTIRVSQTFLWGNVIIDEIGKPNSINGGNQWKSISLVVYWSILFNFTPSIDPIHNNNRCAGKSRNSHKSGWGCCCFFIFIFIPIKFSITPQTHFKFIDFIRQYIDVYLNQITWLTFQSIWKSVNHMFSVDEWWCWYEQKGNTYDLHFHHDSIERKKKPRGKNNISHSVDVAPSLAFWMNIKSKHSYYNENKSRNRTQCDTSCTYSIARVQKHRKSREIKRSTTSLNHYLSISVRFTFLPTVYYYGHDFFPSMKKKIRLLMNISIIDVCCDFGFVMCFWDLEYMFWVGFSREAFKSIFEEKNKTHIFSRRRMVPMQWIIYLVNSNSECGNTKIICSSSRKNNYTATVYSRP